jgi:hypothetical protein
MAEAALVMRYQNVAASNGLVTVQVAPYLSPRSIFSRATHQDQPRLLVSMIRTVEQIILVFVHRRQAVGESGIHMDVAG